MRLAVISDIHGNLEAWRAVLADIDQSGVDEIVSLGDNIGYGPDSEAVMAEIRRRRIPSVLGNHELVIKHPRFYKWFNPHVQKTLDLTFQQLSPETVAQIQSMDLAMVRHGCRLVHGFPRKSALMYLFQMTEEKIFKAFTRFPERLCFVGHTHDLRLIAVTESRVSDRPFARGPNPLSEGSRYLINAGSVGQPRDGDNRAKYVIYDTETDILEVRCLPYDIEAVVQKILAAGYPEVFALRLR